MDSSLYMVCPSTSMQEYFVVLVYIQSIILSWIINSNVANSVHTWYMQCTDCSLATITLSLAILYAPAKLVFNFFHLDFLNFEFTC